MAEPTKPLYVAVTLDIDPDANVAVEGRVDAVSPPIEKGQARVEAAHQGMELACDALRRHGIPATFFYEARTAQMLAQRGAKLTALSEGHEVACHSLKHEDFLGKVSRMPLTRDQMSQAIAAAKSILESMLECRVSGFRAPYTRVNGDVIAALADLGFAYDSSQTRAFGPEWRLAPYLVEGGDTFLTELALPEFRDARGKRMTSYLWPMFEGRRPPEEYLDAIRRTAPTAPNGLFILAFHPWHIAVDEKGRPFAPDALQRNCRDLDALLTGLKSAPSLKLVTLRAYLDLIQNA